MYMYTSYVSVYIHYVRVYTLVRGLGVGLVVSLVFCDDDVFSVFRGMPRAALIVTELGPRATLVRMHAVALAFSVSPPPLSLSLSLSIPRPILPPSFPVLWCEQAGSAATPCRALRGRARLLLGQVDGYPAAITPRLHAHALTHACTRMYRVRYICALTGRIIVMIRFSVVLVTREREMF